MKLRIAITLAAVLMFSPVVCLVVACDFAAHDCCPKSRAMTSCPYDILAAAKVVKPQALATAPLISSIDWMAPTAGLAMNFITVAQDGRDLHVRNRILLI